MPKDGSARTTAAQRVADQERRVEKQRQLIKLLDRQGRSSVSARAMLELMESSLGVMRVSLPLIPD